jgi:uracil-DNA glycosylase
MGWEDLTQRLLGAVVSTHTDSPLVFLAWGRNAQNSIHKLRLGPKHKVLESAHPSPLSAYAGFFGSKPFSNTDEHLEKYGATKINWRIYGVSDDPI